MSVYKFVAELAEEKLRIFFAKMVEMRAYFSVKTDAKVVIYCELSVFFTGYGHFPAVQQLVFTFLLVLKQQLGSVYLFVCRFSPAQSSRKVVSCTQRNDDKRRICMGPFR